MSAGSSAQGTGKMASTVKTSPGKKQSSSKSLSSDNKNTVKVKKSSKSNENDSNWSPLSHTPPAGFLPFSYSEINADFIAHAARYLNETEETRTKALKEMRELLDSDEDLVYTDEDKFLLIFLRTKKYDVNRAVDFFKVGLHYVDSYRHLLDKEDRTIFPRTIKANMIGFLQYRDHKGRAIIYARADAWKLDEISAGDAIHGGVVAVQSAVHNQVNQITGFVVLLDLKELTIHQVLAMSRWMIFGTITLQRACPCHMKAFHVINVPPIYKIGWKLVKPLLSEKMRKRFIFHRSSDLSSLYEHIPREILPPELGGNVPFSNHHWAQDIEAIQNEYYNFLHANYFISQKKKTTED